jgi:hypothetical protein
MAGFAQTITQTEPDDSIGTANATGLTAGSSGVKLAYGNNGDGEFGGTSGDVDFFKLSVAAGQVIMINMANAGTDPDFDPLIGLYNAAGEVVGEADDKGNTSRGYDRTPRLVYTAPAAGDYYVCVTNWIGDTNLPSDPFTPGTSPGQPGGNAGPYQLIIALDAEVPVPQFVGGSTGYPVPAFLPQKVAGTPRYDGLLTISNRSAGTTAAAALTITSYSISGPDADRFFLRGLSLPATIPPGGELNVNVSFNAAGSSEAAEASLNFVSNDPLNQPFVLNTASSPVVGGGVFTVRQINAPAGTTLNNWSVVDSLLDGSLEGGTEFTGTTPSINYGDGAQGHFGSDTPYLNGGTNPENALIQVTGTFRILTAGTYTLVGYSDDGQRLTIDGTALGEFTDYNTNHFYTVDLAAGDHTLEFIVYEGGGGNSAELAISQQPGTFTDYIESTWEILEAAGADADSDGMPDAWETANALDPNSAAGVDGSEGDPDLDGLVNRNEYFFGTNPKVADTDGDGLADGVETDTGSWVGAANTGTNPLRADTDGDGLSDGQENYALANGSNPNRKDTDDDGFADLSEITLGTNPNSAASAPVFVFQPVMAEDFDGVSFHSTYGFTSLGGTFAPGVFDSGVAAQGQVAQLTDTVESNNNSIAWDFVDPSPPGAMQLSFDFRITPAEGSTDPADGIGIGFFRTAAHGVAGARNPATGSKAWENPTSDNGFPDSLMVTFGVYGADVIRVAGPAAPATLLASPAPPFGLANGLFNRAIITVVTNGAASSMLSLTVIEDVNGAAVSRVIFTNLLVPGFAVTEDVRIIAGGRTGGSVAKMELDDLVLATPAAPTPTMALSTTLTGLLASIYDGSASVVDAATMAVTLNGSPLSVTTAKTGAITTVAYATSPGTFFPSGTNTLVFTYKNTQGADITDTRTFQTEPYLLLPTTLALPPTAAGPRGLAVRTYQVQPINAETIANRLDYAEGLLAGASGSPFTGGNVANLAGSTNGVFNVDVINFEQDGGSFGFFPEESLIPGIPGTTSNTDNYVFEAKTWIEFPTTGLYRFGVVADDGFRVSVGHDPVPGVSIVAPAASARILAAVPSIASTPAGGISGPYPNPPVVANVVACEPAIASDVNGVSLITNAAALAGNIALVDRGVSSFAFKLKAVQDAGAIGAIIVNQTVPDGVPIVMGGNGPDLSGVTIPGVMISRADGDALKALLGAPGGLQVKFGSDESTTIGKADLNQTTTFTAAVSAPGLYPIRLINFEGGGGAHCEWYSVDEDGVRHLVNDPNDPAALKAYVSVASVTPASIAIARDGGNVVITYTGVLQSSATLGAGSFTDVAGATSPYVLPLPTSGTLYFRARP